MKIFILNCVLFLVLPGSLFSQIWEAQICKDVPLNVVSTSVADDSSAWMLGTSMTVDESIYNYINTPDFVVRTADGGQTWTSSEIPFGNDYYPGTISAIDKDTALVIGTNWTTGGGRIYRTTDGGQTWQFVPVPFMPNVSYANWMHFFDAKHGICGGDPVLANGVSLEFEIYRTEDSGVTWSLVPAANIPNPLTSEIGLIGYFDAKGDTLSFGTSKGRVFRSANAGQLWTVLTPGVPSGLAPVTALGPNGRIAVAYYNNTTVSTGLRITSNGGALWTSINVPNSGNFKLNAIKYIRGSSTLLMTGRVQNLSGPFYTWVSYNHGFSWMQIDAGNSVQALDFINPGIGWGGSTQFAFGETKAFRYSGSPLVGLLDPKPIELECSISPNPTDAIVQINIRGDKVDHYLLLVNDATGNLILRKDLGTGSVFSCQADLAGRPSGMYVLTISNTRGSTSRVIVKR